jgi:hypothetical protein
MNNFFLLINVTYLKKRFLKNISNKKDKLFSMKTEGKKQAYIKLKRKLKLMRI